jgi:hypothetical protein
MKITTGRRPDQITTITVVVVDVADVAGVTA